MATPGAPISDAVARTSSYLGNLLPLHRCLLRALLYTGFRNSHWPDWLARDYAAVAIYSGLLILIHFGVSDIFIVLGFPALILSGVMNAGRFAAGRHPSDRGVHPSRSRDRGPLSLARAVGCAAGRWLPGSAMMRSAPVCWNRASSIRVTSVPMVN